MDAAGNLYIADQDNNTVRKGYIPPTSFGLVPPAAYAGDPFNLYLTGPPLQTVVLQASSDLNNWTSSGPTH